MKSKGCFRGWWLSYVCMLVHHNEIYALSANMTSEVGVSRRKLLISQALAKLRDPLFSSVLSTQKGSTAIEI